jgi:hypothetical protein
MKGMMRHTVVGVLRKEVEGDIARRLKLCLAIAVVASNFRCFLQESHEKDAT